MHNLNWERIQLKMKVIIFNLCTSFFLHGTSWWNARMSRASIWCMQRNEKKTWKKLLVNGSRKLWAFSPRAVNESHFRWHYAVLLLHLIAICTPVFYHLKTALILTWVEKLKSNVNKTCIIQVRATTLIYNIDQASQQPMLNASIKEHLTFTVHKW